MPSARSEYAGRGRRLTPPTAAGVSTQKVPPRQPEHCRRGTCHLIDQESMPREVRYFLTIRATLKVMASSNSRRSSPVSFLIFSSRYTSVLR